MQQSHADDDARWQSGFWCERAQTAAARESQSTDKSSTCSELPIAANLLRVYFFAIVTHNDIFVFQQTEHKGKQSTHAKKAKARNAPNATKEMRCIGVLYLHLSLTLSPPLTQNKLAGRELDANRLADPI